MSTQPDAPRSSKMPLQARMRFIFSGALILLFAYTAYESWSFQTLARYLPLTVSVLAFVVMVISFTMDVMTYRRTGVVAGDDVAVTASLAGAEVKERVAEQGEEAVPEEVAAELDDPRIGEVEPPREILKRAGVVFLWILGYVVAIGIFGLMIASAAYLLGYLFKEARAGWKVPVIGTAVILVMMNIMRELLNLEWPDYLLESVIPGTLF